MNRDRWNSWVTFAWLIVVFAIVTGLFLVSTLGTIDVPSQDYLGNITWQEEPNPAVWGLAIGQAVAAAMLAAMFSMLNSIYQNSCDLLATSNGKQVNASGRSNTGTSSSSTITGDSGNAEPENQQSKNIVKLSSTGKKASIGLVIYSVEKSSSVYGLLKPGYAICKVNGQDVTSKEKMLTNLVKGENLIEFADVDDQKYQIRLKMNPDELGVVLLSEETV